MKNRSVLAFGVFMLFCFSTHAQAEKSAQTYYHGQNSTRIIIRNTYFRYSLESTAVKFEIEKGVVVKYIDDCSRKYAKVSICSDHGSLETVYVKKTDLLKPDQTPWQKVKVHKRSGWLYVDIKDRFY